MNWNIRLRSITLLTTPLFFGATALADSVPNYTTWAFSGIVRHYEDTNAAVRITVPPPELAAVNVLPGSLLTGYVTLDLDTPDGDPKYMNQLSRRR
jgi:hypothetical protein